MAQSVQARRGELKQRRARRQIAAVATLDGRPVSTISLKPAAVTRPASASTSSVGTLLGQPRVVGMMQYEHSSAHPVCTRSVNAVRPAMPGSSGAPQLPSPSPKRPARRKVGLTRRQPGCRRSSRSGEVGKPETRDAGSRRAAACRRSGQLAIDAIRQTRQPRRADVWRSSL